MTYSYYYHKNIVTNLALLAIVYTFVTMKHVSTSFVCGFGGRVVQLLPKYGSRGYSHSTPVSVRLQIVSSNNNNIPSTLLNVARTSSQQQQQQQRRRIRIRRRSASTTTICFNGRSSNTATPEGVPDTPTTPVPITLLSGFLGSGKTSTLRHLLQNNNGYKVGVVINDVASVNIDAKLILSSNSTSLPPDASTTTSLGSLLLESSDVVELQNGCACCSLSDELLTSIQTLLLGNNNNNQNDNTNNCGIRQFDAIVVELSGVADPISVKQRWVEASTWDMHPVTKMANISRIVTLVDASTFGMDYMSWNTAGDREGWTDGTEEDCSSNRKISELLVEQIEAADTILLNKVDLCSQENDDPVSLVTQVTRGLNTAAEIYVTEYGKVPSHRILGISTTTATTTDDSGTADPTRKDTSHPDHTTTTCTDPTHHHHSTPNHDPTTSSSTSTTTTCKDPTCTDPTHHHHSTHPNQDPSASSTSTSTTCKDPTCTDPTHHHSIADPDIATVSTSEADAKATSLRNLGIGSFVFKSSIPFHSGRLMDLLNKWPVPIKDTLDVELLQEASRDGYEIRGEKRNGRVGISPFVGVLRSKGFCWLAPTSFTDVDLWRHDTAMYWSHAGKHFSITAAGKWWSSLSREDLNRYFEKNPRELDRILKEDFVSEEWGDRRQELVFIGTNLKEDKIMSALQACLLSTDELNKYREHIMLDTSFTTTSATSSS